MASGSCEPQCSPAHVYQRVHCAVLGDGVWLLAPLFFGGMVRVGEHLAVRRLADSDQLLLVGPLPVGHRLKYEEPPATALPLCWPVLPSCCAVALLRPGGSRAPPTVGPLEPPHPPQVSATGGWWRRRVEAVSVWSARPRNTAATLGVAAGCGGSDTGALGQSVVTCAGAVGFEAAPLSAECAAAASGMPEDDSADGVSRELSAAGASADSEWTCSGGDSAWPPPWAARSHSTCDARAFECVHWRLTLSRNTIDEDGSHLVHSFKLPFLCINNAAHDHPVERRK